jgi:hypothetical protein
MATVPFTQATLLSGVIVFQWGPLTTANADGAGVMAAAFGDKSVQFIGTPGAGGTARIQGHNAFVDAAANYGNLRSPDSVVIGVTASLGLFQILENTTWIRPFISAGDGTTSLTCYLLCRPNTRQSY